MSRQHERPDGVVDVYRMSVSQPDAAESRRLLQSIVRAVVEVAAGVDRASITITQADGSTETAADTDPAFPGEAPSSGAATELTVDVFRTGSASAAFTLHSRTGRDLSGYRATAMLFAAQAALALELARTTETLQAALASRAMIGRAVGIVMERYRLDEDRALAFLVRQSQDSNIKLRAVAQAIVDGPGGT